MSRNDSRFSALPLTRRQFASTSAVAAGAAAFAAVPVARAQNSATARKPLIERGATVLLQGDSITDAGRDKNDAAVNSPPALGGGYAWLAASQLLVDRPGDDLKIFNRGISGNKVFQLDERWQADCLDLKPDVLSILIGVNDFAHALNGDFEGTAEIYEKGYRELLQRTKDALPKVRLVVCEPFVLRCGAVNDKWFPAFDDYRAAARRVADGAGAAFVPFQTMFDAASKVAPPERWAADGIHPSADGAALMAHTWRNVVGS